ncbi:hypothetical protein PROFUN_01632 [Planoprotostelium fungivorum]|uniref:Uncharacterized protein n=1 Tax=Planoprotostelium fungivorum TaxID=1890364 RepID=A0A2P6NTX2_9EUKA|nr:hypothetical protein PROFUN_01632 [Planoprotostelium fungivorum]
MDDLHSSEEAAFVQEDVQNIIKETSSYHHAKVPQWTNSVVEQCLKRLTALNKPFKYVEERSWVTRSKFMFLGQSE